MKRLMFIGFCIVFTLMFGITGVKADNDNLIVIFKEGETVLIQDINTSEYKNRQDDNVKVGDTLNFVAKSCPKNKIVVDTNAQTASISASDCQDVNAAWTSSNTAVATVENGVLKVLGAGKTTITASAAGADDGTLIYTFSETSNNSTPTTGDQTQEKQPTISEDEPSNLVEKKQVNKETPVEKETVTYGTQTKVNPTTGVKEAMTFLVPLSLLLGSGVVLRRRFN